jgi:potassium-transporting ATPase KdpC subunit
MMRQLRPALTLMAFMTITLGVAYPLLVTAVSRLLFPVQSSGSLLHEGGVLVGSTLIGQHFSDPKYFWGRPSATAPQPYNGAASGASNLGPLNPALLDQVDANLKMLEPAQPAAVDGAAGGAADGAAGDGADEAARDGAARAGKVPVDLVTASASGLDPQISVAGAQFQVARIARARHLAPAAVQALIDRLRSGPLFGLIGEPQVNVLELNLALDHIANQPHE